MAEKLYRYKLWEKGVSLKGAVFLKVLSEKPQDINQLVNEAKKILSPQDDYGNLIEEMESFYQDLEEKGFIVSGATEEELRKKDRV
ncbi:hypothetical protein AGMMS4952_03260 [Spirochaetia bacterium]|nr:hypothetical protein AGMMS4952_03260 [Spirochaetia bacterium]